MATAEERQLLSHLDRMLTEGRQAREQTDLKEAESLIDFAAGQQWPRNLPRGFV